MPAKQPQSPEALYAPTFFKHYAGAVVDTDLVAEGLAPCRFVRCATAGNLSVKRAHDGVTVTIPFTAGETQFMSANALVASASTATDVTIYW